MQFLWNAEIAIRDSTYSLIPSHLQMKYTNAMLPHGLCGKRKNKNKQLQRKYNNKCVSKYSISQVSYMRKMHEMIFECNISNEKYVTKFSIAQKEKQHSNGKTETFCFSTEEKTALQKKNRSSLPCFSKIGTFCSS